MLTKLYIEALIAEKSLADQVWVLWNAGDIADGLAAWAWFTLAKPELEKYQINDD